VAVKITEAKITEPKSAEAKIVEAKTTTRAVNGPTKIAIVSRPHAERNEGGATTTFIF